MKGKRLLVLVTALSLVFPARIDYAAIRGTFDRVNYYSESFTKGVGAGTLESTRADLESFEESFVGTIIGFLTGLVEFVFNQYEMSLTEDPLIAQVADGFVTVGRSLDRNLNAIKNLKHELKVEIRGLSLKGQLEDIEALVFLYELLVQKRNNRSVDDFLDACYLSRVREKPQWFANALTNEDPSNLKHLILAQGDKQRLNSFYEQMISLFFQSVLMNSACIATRYRSSNNLTLQTYTQDVADETKMYVERIKEALDRDMDLLTNHFIQFAMNDVKECAEQYANYDNKDAVTCLATKFRAKYARKFIAIAYGEKKSLLDQDNYISPLKQNRIIRRKDGTCDSYAHTFLDLHLRNYVVCFPSDCASQDWKNKAAKCNSDILNDQSESCVENVNRLVQCMNTKNAEFTLISCRVSDEVFEFNTTISIAYTRRNDVSFLICK